MESESTYLTNSGDYYNMIYQDGIGFDVQEGSKF